MAHIVKNIDKLRLALDKVRTDLAKLASDQDDIEEKLELYSDERWLWVCEVILGPEKERVAGARCRVAPEAIVLGALAQGQFNECEYLLKLKESKELQAKQCEASIAKSNLQISQLQIEIANP